MKRLRPNSRNRRETFYPVTCPDCLNVRYLRAFDARRVEREQRFVCGVCQRSAAGKRGYVVTTLRYGEKIAVKHCRAWQLANPSRPAQEVARILDLLGVPYQRESWLATKASGKRQRVYLLDFELAGGRVIEVDGEWAHGQPSRIKRDRALRSLLTRRGMPLLRISDRDIHEGRALEMVRAWLVETAHVYAAYPDDAHSIFNEECEYVQ